MSDKKIYGSPFPRKKEYSVANKYWKLFVEDIRNRTNFNEGMLKNLEILCSLYQEYEELKEIIKSEGYYHLADGRYGVQKKPHPCIAQRNKCLDEIRAFTKILSLNPGKEYSPEEPKKDEWS